MVAEKSPQPRGKSGSEVILRAECIPVAIAPSRVRGPGGPMGRLGLSSRGRVVAEKLASSWTGRVPRDFEFPSVGFVSEGSLVSGFVRSYRGPGGRVDWRHLRLGSLRSVCRGSDKPHPGWRLAEEARAVESACHPVGWVRPTIPKFLSGNEFGGGPSPPHGNRIGRSPDSPRQRREFRPDPVLPENREIGFVLARRPSGARPSVRGVGLDAGSTWNARRLGSSWEIESVAEGVENVGGPAEAEAVAAEFGEGNRRVEVTHSTGCLDFDGRGRRLFS